VSRPSILDLDDHGSSCPHTVGGSDLEGVRALPFEKRTLQMVAS
jgi:hypothetical protein